MSSLAGFSGSRSLPQSAWPLVGRVVRAVLDSGRGMAVGCAAGADAAVLSAVLAVPTLRPLASGGPALSVFAVFGPGEVCALPGLSSVPLVLHAARPDLLPEWKCEEIKRQVWRRVGTPRPA